MSSETKLRLVLRFEDSVLSIDARNNLVTLVQVSKGALCAHLDA